MGLQSDALGRALPPLAAMMEQGKLPHAILLEGGSAAERRRAAEDLACALLCSGAGEDALADYGGVTLFGAEDATPSNAKQPCGTCAHCKKVRAGIHPDYTFLEGGIAAKSLPIDAVRQLRQDAFVLPNEAEHKVYVLHNAQTMTPEAQNALLKLLEEPPGFVCLLLTVPTKQRLLTTVLSRVLAFSLGDVVQEALDAEQEARVATLAAQLATAWLQARNGWAVLQATAPYEVDRDLLRETLPVLLHTLHAQLLQNVQLAPRILPLLAGVQDLQEALERNANQNLLVARLALLGWNM